MKYLTIEHFVGSLIEKEIWKLIEDYENWKKLVKMRTPFCEINQEILKIFKNNYI